MRSEKIVETNLPPCSISSTPSGIIVGTYELNKTSGTRTGSLDVYDTDLELKQSVDTPYAVLDTKVHHEKIFVANSIGEVPIYNSKLEEIKKIKLGDGLVTQLAVEHDTLAATMTTGEMIIYDLKSEKITFTSKIHDLEAWTVAFDGTGSTDTVYTGGDDRQLSCTDLRIPYTLWKVKPHEAGVTSILPRDCSATTLWTGGYDDCINSFDLRTRRVADSCNLGGGVWRLIENLESSKILACCMYGGLRILESQTFGIVGDSLTNHESMVYGGLWLNGTQGLTCSFYDKKLQKWSL